MSGQNIRNYINYILYNESMISPDFLAQEIVDNDSYGRPVRLVPPTAEQARRRFPESGLGPLAQLQADLQDNPKAHWHVRYRGRINGNKLSATESICLVRPDGNLWRIKPRTSPLTVGGPWEKGLTESAMLARVCELMQAIWDNPALEYDASQGKLYIAANNMA